MKLSKFAKQVKQSGLLYLCHVADGGIWLGTRYAFYRAAGLPETVDADTILTILDFDTKQASKIIVNENHFDSEQDIFGMNLSDNAELDIKADKKSVAAVYKGVFATALLCSDGELVFYDETELSPLADVLKESDYVQTVVRIAKNGIRYVVIRDGFETVAGILARNILTKEFFSELQEFQALCFEQYLREESRKARDMTQEETDGEQECMEGHEDED